MPQLDEWTDGYVLGWVTGFIGAIAALYAIRHYFPDLVPGPPATRLLIIRKEDTPNAGTDASDRMAGSGEARANA